MKNNTFLETIDRNLPTICTGASAIIGLMTTGYSIWAGIKIKEASDGWDSDTPSSEKIVTVAKYAAPAVVGGVAAAGFAIAANRENDRRMLAMAGTVAALKMDKDKARETLEDFKNKTKEILGEEKATEVEEAVADDTIKKNVSKCGIVPSTIETDKRVRFHDAETGYIFYTTLRKFQMAMNVINERCCTKTQSMEDFYLELLGDDYEPTPLHNSIGFGSGCSDAKCFMPEFEGETAEDMSLGYRISYDYDNLAELKGKREVLNKYDGYSY